MGWVQRSWRGVVVARTPREHGGCVLHWSVFTLERFSVYGSAVVGL